MVAELISASESGRGISDIESQSKGTLRPLRWTRDEYYALAEAELLDGKRVELIEGEIRSKSGRPLRWSLAEYFGLIEAGMLDGKRVLMMEGELIEMSPMARPQGLALLKCERSMREVFAEGFFIQNQMPLPVLLGSDPEPDIAVFRGEPEQFAQTHPTHPVLIVEVSDSTLRYDQNVKASLYARAGVTDYWIINIRARQLEVRREPVEDATQPFDWRYNSLQVLGESDEFAPLHASGAVKVRDLLP